MDESSESSSPRPRNRVLASCKHALQAANSCTLPVLPCLVGRQRRLRFARYARKAAANLDIFGRLGCRCDSASELQCARPRSAASPALPALPASEPHGPRVPLRIITCTSPDFACACRSSLAARLAFLAALTRLHHQAKRLAHTADHPIHPDNRCQPILSKPTCDPSSLRLGIATTTLRPRRLCCGSPDSDVQAAASRWRRRWHLATPTGTAGVGAVNALALHCASSPCTRNHPPSFFPTSGRSSPASAANTQSPCFLDEAGFESHMDA